MKWIEKPSAFYLVDEANKKILGYILNYLGSWKVRKLTITQSYDNEEDISYRGEWNRSVVCENTPDVNIAKRKLEEALNIVEIDMDKPDVLKFLAQLKNVEVFGKLEIVIRVEGLNKNGN